MIPLRITARLSGQVSLPDGAVALDGLLAWAVATRDGMPPVDAQDVVPPIEIPVAREPGGRFHLASFSEQAFDDYERGRYVNRRFPTEIAQTPLGSTSVKRVQLSTGPTKSYRIPIEVGHLVDDRMEWWCLGDAEVIRELLCLVGYVGKKRGVGLGRVARWDVEPCEPWPGFPVVRDGRALRTLPPDWPGIVEPRLAMRVLTYPYWQRWREEMCAC